MSVALRSKMCSASADSATRRKKKGATQQMQLQQMMQGAAEGSANPSRDEHHRGHIGHKGIGFKSNYVVSDCPQVFSRGFHFQLGIQPDDAAAAAAGACGKSERERERESACVCVCVCAKSERARSENVSEASTQMVTEKATAKRPQSKCKKGTRKKRKNKEADES